MNKQRQLFEQHSSLHIIETLAPFITEQRQARIKDVVSSRLMSIHIALESPYDPHNAAAVIRNCEALGVINLHIIDAEHDGIRSQGVTQGCHSWIKLHFYPSIEVFLQQTKGQFILAGACMDGTQTLNAVPIDKPLCVLLGNENRGLSQTARDACDLTFRIPMFGMSESLNLSVSAGISLYDITQRKRLVCGASDLSPAQADQLTAEYFLNSVQSRLVEQLL